MLGELADVQINLLIMALYNHELKNSFELLIAMDIVDPIPRFIQTFFRNFDGMLIKK